MRRDIPELLKDFHLGTVIERAMEGVSKPYEHRSVGHWPALDTRGVTEIGYSYWGAMSLEEYAVLIDVPSGWLAFAQREHGASFGGGKPHRNLSGRYTAEVPGTVLAALCQVIETVGYFDLESGYSVGWEDVPVRTVTVVRSGERKTVRAEGIPPPPMWGAVGLIEYLLSSAGWREARRHRQTDLDWDQILDRRFLAPEGTDAPSSGGPSR